MWLFVNLNSKVRNRYKELVNINPMWSQEVETGGCQEYGVSLSFVDPCNK